MRFIDARAIECNVGTQNSALQYKVVFWFWVLSTGFWVKGFYRSILYKFVIHNDKYNKNVISGWIFPIRLIIPIYLISLKNYQKKSVFSRWHDYCNNNPFFQGEGRKMNM